MTSLIIEIAMETLEKRIVIVVYIGLNALATTESSTAIFQLSRIIIYFIGFLKVI